MKLDKERLRVLAEAAISTQASSEWVTHAAEFESNTTPDVVLELLSENAALAAEVERLRSKGGAVLRVLYSRPANHIFGRGLLR